MTQVIPGATWPHTALDSNGRSFKAGYRVRAWWSGTEYTGTVERIITPELGEPFGLEIRPDEDAELEDRPAGELVPGVASQVTAISPYGGER